MPFNTIQFAAGRALSASHHKLNTASTDGHRFFIDRLLRTTMPNRNDYTLASTPQRDLSLCKYPGRKCPRPRILKSTGELHNLCQQHHERASASKRESQLTRHPILAEDPNDWWRLVSGVLPPQVTVCGYRGRPCNRPRATKSNGQLHQFCGVHRDLANCCQQKSVRRSHERTGVQSTSNCVSDGWSELAMVLPHDERGRGESMDRVDKELDQPSGLSEARPPCIAIAIELNGDDQIAVENEWLAHVFANMLPEEFNAIIRSAAGE